MDIHISVYSLEYVALFHFSNVIASNILDLVSTDSAGLGDGFVITNLFGTVIALKVRITYLPSIPKTEYSGQNLITSILI